MIAGVWAAFRASRIAQGISAIAIIFVGYTSWLARHNKNVREREERRIKREIERQANDRREAARVAVEEVRGRYTTDDLNREQLRKLRQRDQNNRLGVQRSEAD